MDNWTPIHSTTVQEIEDYMRSLNLPEKVPQKGANSKQVSGSHYQREIQPWDIIQCWGLGFWRGNVVKYVLRSPDKNGKEDLEKAKHYLEFLIENYDTLDPKNM